jgi:PBP1b-binding outer membrane lipoprotein LpoB
MTKMKKLLTLTLIIITLGGCTKDDFIIEPEVSVTPQLQIKNSVGIKLETPFVTNEVAMNVKTEINGVVTIKIFDITNKVVSKEEIEVKSGNNILKVYTSALPPSAYRIGLFNSNGVELGITDFNKL